MIELRWREVSHPNTRRDDVLTVPSGPWSFILEFRQWSDTAKCYTNWTPVPVAWTPPPVIGNNRG